MGVVYKATDPTIRRTVALKTMRLDVHAEKHDAMLRRFQNEARAAGALNHPNIVTVYDAGEADGIFYIAMEYIEGPTLSRLLHDRRSLSAQEAVDLGTQICAGLQYAHFRKVVHRDIKPANIMLAGTQVKITDFGIAKSGATITHTGEVLGTPNYMSPEQVKGLELDGRSDIFSTGVVLYEMITGERPFTGENVNSIAYKIVNETPLTPREVDVSIHPGLSMIVTKCLSKDPEDRYQEASDLSTALKSYKIVSVPNFAPPVPPSPPSPITPPKVVEPPQPVVQPLSPAPKPATPVAAAVQSARSQETPAPKVAEPPQVRRTITLFLVLAAVLVVAAFAFRALRPVHQSETTPAPDVTAPAPTEPTPEELVANSKVQEPTPADSVVVPSRGSRSAAPNSGVGDLRITSNPPGAQVSIDGTTQDYYITPFNSPPLKPGTHLVTITAPGLPPQTRRVDVAARRRTNLDFQLAGDKAIYNISSAPSGADIWIDGSATGQSTPAQLPLQAGSHKITLRMDGFEPAELITRSSPGESVNLAPRLQARNSVEISSESGAETPSLGAAARIRRPGSLNEIPEGKGVLVIRTRPTGVTVTVDGNAVPRMTSFRFPLPAGSHTVVVQKTGYQSVTRTVDIQEGQTSDIDVRLARQQ